MAKPTVTEIRDFLEGYGITSAILSDLWITARLDNTVIPHVEEVTRQKFSGIATAVEYHSGTGKNILMLDKKPIVSLTVIEYVLGGDNISIMNNAMIEVIADEGILKSKTNYDEAFLLPVFAKGEYNIKVTYTYGYADYPGPVKDAVIMLTANMALGHVGSRTGGGNVSGQAYNRTFGNRGKWTEERNDLARQAYALLKPYSTGIVGS
jgi:hypothetical protein